MEKTDFIAFINDNNKLNAVRLYYGRYTGMLGGEYESCDVQDDLMECILSNDETDYKKLSKDLAEWLATLPAEVQQQNPIFLRDTVALVKLLDE